MISVNISVCDHTPPKIEQQKHIKRSSAQEPGCPYNSDTSYKSAQNMAIPLNLPQSSTIFHNLPVGLVPPMIVLEEKDISS